MLSRSSLSLAAAILSLLLSGEVVQAQTVDYSDQMTTVVDPACPLDCTGGGICTRGNADYSKFSSSTTNSNTAITMPFLRDANMGGYHCDCPPGRTGLTCEREYETCGDGKHYCFHGGRCMEGLTDEYGNEQFFCDCNTANHDGKNYAGKFCQAESINACGTTAEYGHVFCTNGGVCRDNFEEHLDQPCVCQEGFEGPHCEYQQGEAPECNLKCQNGGHARIGNKDYPPNAMYNEFWKTSQDHCFCLCPPGYFGLDCSIKGEQCGEDHCFNGGTCLTQDNGDGTQQNYCDCTTANTSGTSYAGKYCEAESTSFCSRMADQNGHQFCVNGGHCRTESHLGCDCLEGFSGPICEFRDTVFQETTCDLQCENNGICRNGAKDISFLKKFNLDMPNTDVSYSDDFQHCVCPRGFVGLRCENQVLVCPGGEHVCMNGAECIPDDSSGRLEYKCDCDSIRLPFDKFTGSFCELKSTELCTYNGRPGEGLNRDAFCVNGGRCKAHAKVSEAHAGCECPPGFEGDHCESLSGDNSATDEVVEDDNGKGMSTAGTIVLVLFLGIVTLGAIGAYIYHRRQMRDIQSDIDSGFDQILKSQQQPPTLDNIMSMNSEHADADDADLLDVSQHSESFTASVNGDGIFKDDEKLPSQCQLENVSIL